MTSCLVMGAQAAQYTYDGRGNVTRATTASGATTYTYNAANDLTGLTLPSGTAYAYGYDAAGRRVSQTTGGTTTNYL